MPFRISIIVIAALAAFSVSCNSSRNLTSSNKSSSRHVTAVSTKKMSGPDLSVYKDDKLKALPDVKPGTPEARYIDAYKDIAISEMKRTGIPASITLAQGMLESDFGRSRLSREGNNHFGIKCHNGWDGATIYHDDDKRNDCFRKYNNSRESYSDHSDFLKSGTRYRFLFELPPSDYKQWAYGLKKAGYATNPEYANLLIKKIEDYDLYVFDQALTARNSRKVDDEKKQENKADLKKSEAISESIELEKINEKTLLASADDGVVLAKIPRVKENNRVQYIVVKDGDTREKLEKEFGLLKWELWRYNELEQGFRLEPGQILYIQPKREKAEPGRDYYTASKGDTYYSISQKYGIKLKSLWEMNRVSEGAEPKPGEKIWLRSTKPVN